MEGDHGRIETRFEAMENRMLIKLGGLIVVVAGLMLAFLRMFPAPAA